MALRVVNMAGEAILESNLESESLEDSPDFASHSDHEGVDRPDRPFLPIMDVFLLLPSFLPCPCLPFLANCQMVKL